MPSIYYKCSKCHKKFIEILEADEQSKIDCLNCNAIVNVYPCIEHYWWELLIMTIKDFFRRIK